MNTEHASETELQEYVSDKYGCSQKTIAHIEGCESCRAGATAYRLLFAEIKKEQKPAFDFDVSALLLPRLTAGITPIKAGQPPYRSDRPFRYVMTGVILFITCIPAYLFRKNIFYVFTGVSYFFLYTILAAALIIVLLRVMHMYKKFQRRMEALHFY